MVIVITSELDFVTKRVKGYRASIVNMPIGRLRRFYSSAVRDANKIAESSKQTHSSIEIRDFVTQQIKPVQNLAGGY